MIWLALCLSLYALIGDTHARGAGRAFPLLAENYAIEEFQRINPDIDWDPTNYLVDRSGQYANCDRIERRTENIGELTPEGNTIRAIFDYTEGAGVDAESVNDYIVQVLDRWIRSREHHTTIRDAENFGCSVRPGCSLGRGRVPVITVVCLFSPGWGSSDPSGVQRGQAFTPEQYNMVEGITGNNWDRSHFLENLSGFEVSCSMLLSGDWTFTKAKDMADGYGMKVMGLKGSERNYGSTQVAMEKILKDFKAIRYASRVGCSVIPDCIDDRGDLGGDMWVVVTCIYEDSIY